MMISLPSFNYKTDTIVDVERAVHNGTDWQDDGAKKYTRGLGKKYERG